MYNRRKSFGVGYDSVKWKELLDIVDMSIQENRKTIIGYTNLYGAYLRRKQRIMHEFFKDADIIYCDGTPQHVWRRILWGDVGTDNKFTLTHNLPIILSAFERAHYRVYFLGSDVETLEQGLTIIRRQLPKLKVEGHHGYFDKNVNSLDNTEVLKDIEDFSPHIIFVGMGMPIQEKWINENKGKISAPVLWSVGAAIEYYGGKYSLSPKWAYNWGLEWAYRLYKNPRRFWYRYLVSPFFLIPEVFKDIWLRMAR